MTKAKPSFTTNCVPPAQSLPGDLLFLPTVGSVAEIA